MAGWTVGLGCPSPDSLARWSNTTSFWHRVPPVEQGLEAFLEATAGAVREQGYELVLSAADAETLGLCYGRDQIPAVIPWASYETVKRSFDKLDLVETARRAGLEAPDTVPATDEALADVSGPIVVKSRFHWTPDSGVAPARLEAKVCRDAREARAKAEDMRSKGGEPLLQEIMEGAPHNLHVVTDHDRQIVVAVQQLSQPLFYPPGSGRRTRSRTVDADPGLVEASGRFLEELDWFGFTGLGFLAGVDGVPRLTDFNGRIPMHLDQSTAAGANVLAIWAALATNRKPPPIQRPKSGVRYHWGDGDLKRALRERRGGVVRDLLGTFGYAIGATHTLWYPRDLQPMLRYLQRLARRRIGRKRTDG